MNRPSRDVRHSLTTVEGPTDEQLRAAARTLASCAVRVDASRAELRDVLGAIGIPDLDPCPPGRDQETEHTTGDDHANAPA